MVRWDVAMSLTQPVAAAQHLRLIDQQFQYTQLRIVGLTVGQLTLNVPLQIAHAFLQRLMGASTKTKILNSISDHSRWFYWAYNMQSIRCRTHRIVTMTSSICCNLLLSSVKCSISFIILRKLSSLAATNNTRNTHELTKNISFKETNLCVH